MIGLLSRLKFRRFSQLPNASLPQNIFSNSFTKEFKRSHLIGELNEKALQKEVVLAGWIAKVRRVSKNLFFLLLRDHSGLVQVTLTRTHISDEVFLAMQDAVDAGGIASETVIGIRGIVQPRPMTMYNDDMPTGRLEIFPSSFQIFNRVQGKLPFTLDEKYLPAEETRFQYRYLDMRRSVVQNVLRLRSQINSHLRTFFESKGFIEVETPVLFKSTPEGAKEFLVPRPGGLNYALPQSPQQFKQLLMVGGIDKYYQIARCFRDEGMRADRQPEFTQLDMEMSFVTQEDVMIVMEEAVRGLWNRFRPNEILENQFKRLTYDQAMSRYGSDKPDLRFKGEIAFSIPGSKRRTVIEGLILKGRGRQSLNRDESFQHCFPLEGLKSKRVIQAFESATKSVPGTLLSWKGSNVDKCEHLDEREKLSVNDCVSKLGLDLGPRDCLLLACRDLDANVGCTALGKARLAALEVVLAEASADLPLKYNFLWVHSFPLLTPASQESTAVNPNRRFDSMHHPFTASEQEAKTVFSCETPLQLRAHHYDLVLNGQEIGGGSIRIHNAEFQERLMRELLDLSDAQIDNFRHLLKALSMGAPPHGGMALGLDRIVAILAGTNSIRDVIAYPKTSTGHDLCFGSPN